MYVYILVIVYHDVLNESKMKVIKRAILNNVSFTRECDKQTYT